MAHAAAPNHPQPDTTAISFGGAWGYLLAAGAAAGIAALGFSDRVDAAVGAVVLVAALPWLFVQPIERLLVLTVLALPFDSWKMWSFFSPPNVFLMVAALKWALRHAPDGGRSRNPTYWPLIIAIIVTFLSALLGEEPAVSGRYAITIAAAGLLAYLISEEARTERTQARLMDALLLGGLFLGATAILQVIAYQFGVGLWDVYGDYWIYSLNMAQIKATGILDSPGNLPNFLIPPVSCGVTLWGTKMNARRRVFVRSATVIAGTAAVLTVTRAALMTLFLLIAGTLVWRATQRLRSPRPAVLGGLVPLAAIGWFVVPKLVLALNNLNPISTYNRLSIYASSVNSVREHPVLGRGLGALVRPSFENAELYALASSVQHVNPYMAETDSRATHSTLFQIAVGMGMAGLLAFGWLTWRSGRALYAAARSRGQWQSRYAGAVFVSLAATYLVLMFNDGITMKPTWVLLGMGWALSGLAPGAENPTRDSDPVAGT